VLPKRRRTCTRLQGFASQKTVGRGWRTPNPEQSSPFDRSGNPPPDSRTPGCQAGIATAGVRFPARAADLSLLHSVQTGSGAHPASYPVGTGGKAAGM
jgi:hypothetical protein